MNEHTKYDPEDIEKLLRDKAFDELLDKERAFVNNHISSEEEYSQMRLLLLDLENQDWEEAPEPPKSLRVDLISQHKKSHKKAIRVWLNSLFATDYKQLSWFQKPIFQIGFATVLVVGSIFFFTNKNGLDQPLADLREKPKTEQQAPSAPAADESTSESKSTEIKDINEKPISDRVDIELAEPLVAPPIIQENQNEIIAEKQLTEVSSETETRDESSVHQDASDNKNDDVKFSDNSTLTNTDVENNFGYVKDQPGNPINTDISEAEPALGNEVPEIAQAEEVLDFLNDDEVAAEEVYMEDDQEETILQEIVGVSATSVERVNNSSDESLNKKETKSDFTVTLSVKLQEQSEIIDQLFIAY